MESYRWLLIDRCCGICDFQEVVGHLNSMP
jgi:hypothetical protein